jgi:hypothetical protein
MPGLLERFGKTTQPAKQPAAEQPEPGTLSMRMSGDDMQQDNALAAPQPQLPPGAIDFDKYGNPYFGEGLSGILKRWKWNYTKDVKEVDESEWLDLRDRWKEALRIEREVDQQKGTAMQGALALETASKVWQAGTAQGSLLSPVLKTIGASVGALADLFSIPAQKIEQAIGATQAFKEAANELSSPLPRLDQNLLTRAIEHLPVGLAYDFTRIALSDSENKWDYTKQKISDGWQAGRIFYSQLFDATLKEKFLEEYRAGKDPGLIAIKLANPKAEIVGQLFLDPLNLVGAFGKGVKTAKELQAAEAAVTASGLLKSETGRAALKAMQEAVDDVSGARALDNLVTAQTEVVTNIQKNSRLLNVGFSGDSLTMSSRQNAIVSKGKELLGNMALVLKERGLSYDAVAEAVWRGVQSVSENADDMRKGLAGLAQLPNANMWLADDYVESFIVLRNIMTNADGVLDGGQLKRLMTVKNPAEFADEAQKLYLNAAKSQFKDVSELEEAYKLTRQADRTGGIVSEETRAFAKQYEALPNHVKYLNRVNEALKTVTGPINRVLFPAYFNLQGGVAVRNVIGNQELILLDKGIGAWFNEGKYWSVENIKKYITDLYGVMPESAHGFKSLVASMTDRPAWGFGKLMESGEEAAATRIVGASIRDTFKKMLPKAMPNLRKHIEAGKLTERQSKMLVRLIERNRYNVRKAVEEFRDIYKIGNVEDWRNLDHVTDFEREALESLDLWDEIEDLARKGADDPAEVEALFAKLQKVIDDRAAAAAKEVPGLSDSHPAVESWGDLVKAAEEGHLDGDEQQYFTAIMEYAEQVRLDYQDLLDDVALKAQQVLNESGRGQEAAALGQEMNRIRSTLRSAGKKTASEAYEITQEAWRWTDEIKRIKKGQNDKLVAYWKRAGLVGDPPLDLNKRSLLRELWRQRFEKVSDLWNSSFDAIVGESETVLQQMSKIVDTGELDAMAQRARYITQQAQATRKAVYQNGALKIIPKEDLEYVAKTYGASLDDVIQKINKRKGTQYKTAEDVPTRDILEELRGLRAAARDVRTLAKNFGVGDDAHVVNIVNKYAGGEYKSIEEIPYQQAKEALEKRSIEKAAEAPQGPRQMGLDEAQQPAVTMDEAVSTPRHELPDEVSTEFERVAKELQRELFEGEAGKRLFTESGVIGQSSTNAQWYRDLYQQGMRKPAIDKALEKIIKDNGLDKGKSVERVKEVILERISFGDPKNGIPPNIRVLQAMGADQATLQRALDDYNEIAKTNLTLDEFLKGGGQANEIVPSEKAGFLEPDTNQAYFDEEGNLITPNAVEIPPPQPTGTDVSASRAWNGNAVGAKHVLENIKQGILDRWGKTNAERTPNPDLDAVLEEVATTVEPRIGEIKAIALRIAKAQRDFTLLDYGSKTYMDMFKAYVLPFHFYYTRQYRNWVHRIATHPEIAAGYGKYKDYLEKENGNLPDWYKQQLNINPFADNPNMEGKTFLGIPLNHPLYVNLEATFNPLYGLTGTDYNDPIKRHNWALATIDDMGKFGPSIYAPIQLGIAALLFKQGETDVAARWAGRLFPETVQIKALTSTLFGRPIELDPAVQLFSGGIDVHERGRMAYAAAQLIQSGQFTPEQIMLDFQAQEGDAWDAAYQLATQSRAASAFTSYFLGVGFKPRSANDVAVEEMYVDLNKLYAVADMMSPEEYRMAWEHLRSKHPDGFVDAVLLAKKGGDKRDAALAYEVLNRIPPGDMSEALAVIGLSNKEISKFYDSKGFTDKKVKFTKQEKERFMAAVIDLATMLKIPDAATRQEWTEAKTTYQVVYRQIEEELGEDIWDKVSYYYDLKDDNRAKAAEFGALHPEIFAAMQMKREAVLNTPVLSAYYAGIETIEAYVDGKIRQQLTDAYGSEIYDIQAGYYNSPNPRGYLSQHPELRRFWSDKHRLEAQSEAMFYEFATRLPQGRPAQFQEGFEPQSDTQEALFEALQPQDRIPSWDQISQEMPEWLQQEIAEHAIDGRQLSKRAQNQLDYLADVGGYYNADSLLHLAVLSIIQPDVGNVQQGGGLLGRFGP